MKLGAYLLPRRKATLHSLAVLILLFRASIARTQTADAGEAGAATDGENVAATDTGFALGEPSKPTPPYKAPAAPAASAGPTQPAPGNWYAAWEAWKADLKSKTGTSFDLYVNPTDQMILEHPHAALNRGDIWYSFHLEQSLWRGARLVTDTRGGTGEGLNRYVENLFNLNQNTGEAAGIYVAKLYLEQKLLNDHLTISVGKLDLVDTFDDNEVGSWNFIPATLARDPAIPAPHHALGATARWDVTDWLYAQGGVADDGGNVAQTGFNTAFRSGEPYFGIFEAGIQPHLLGRPGTYRFIVWDASTTTERFVGGREKHGDVGAALSFDQQVTDHLGVFTRYGYSDPSIDKINDYWSIGGTYTGLIPDRQNDVLGAGVALALLSGDYRRTSGLASTQTQADFYYTAAIRPWISVTPDIQLLVNPDHTPGPKTALVAALNVIMRF